MRRCLQIGRFWFRLILVGFLNARKSAAGGEDQAGLQAYSHCPQRGGGDCQRKLFVWISSHFCIFELLFFCQVVEMVKKESLVEEAMQVVVEQELDVEELPAILQVDLL